MTRTVDELLVEAFMVQDACNLSGVVHSFSTALSDLRENGINNTADLNTHPVSILYADKIAHLTGTQHASFEVVMAAYDAAARAKQRIDNPECDARR